MGVIAPAIAALGTAGAGAAGAAAGLFSAGGLGATLAGGLLSGIGAGMMEKKRFEKEEDMMIGEENRRKANYEGVGDATSWSNKFVSEPMKNTASVAPSGGGAAPAGSMKYNSATGKIEKV